MSSDYSAPITHILQFFIYGHLPEELQDVYRPFRALAETIAQGSDNPETIVALRKLIESKDAAVRARLIQLNWVKPSSPALDAEETGF